ncbi:MAG: ABC transporter ATP-binding protein [Thermodesulfobacteriota bacterium]|jgi:branched-chain amino acid transport system ATP-binding protein
MPILKVNNISISFGGLRALTEVNLELSKGDIVGLIGPNGSGKTTLLNVISGIYAPEIGTIHLQDKEITLLPPHARAAKGIGRTFQIQHLFSNMTVLENVMTGLHKDIRTGVFGAAFRFKRVRAEERIAKEKALEALKFFRLQEMANRMITDLSSIEQRMVEIARALATNHKIILLDEPAAALSPAMVIELGTLLKRIRDEKGVSIILVEHVISLVLTVSDKITVLNFGRVIAEGKPDKIRRDPAVLEAYLGKEGGYA